MVSFQLNLLITLILNQSVTSFQHHFLSRPFVGNYNDCVDSGSKCSRTCKRHIVTTSPLAAFSNYAICFGTRDTVRWMASNNNNNGNDDDDFDPLMSPHAYPKGTSSSPSSRSNSNDNDGDDWSPFKMRSVKDDFRGANDDEYGVEKSVFTRKWSTTINSVEGAEGVEIGAGGRKEISAIDVDGNKNDNDNYNNEKDSDISTFDPLISPHFYPKGTSAGPIQSDKKKKATRIGVLLIDHGSRREASNVHLEKLAELYQERAPSNYVIKAAHMEIASPSIKDGIEALIEVDNVEKIICHPYFLSPGRHVVEDIPQLIEEAMDELKVGLRGDVDGGVSSGNNVEVLTTNHVGSSMTMMVDLISTMVDDTVGVEPDSGFVQKDSSSLGGFFGEVQRMLDEQL